MKSNLCLPESPSLQVVRASEDACEMPGTEAAALKTSNQRQIWAWLLQRTGGVS